MPGRLSQDCLENLFSVVRSTNSKSNTVQFKMSLKLITISQFLTASTKGNYDIDDSDYAVDFISIIILVLENSNNLDENVANLNDVDIDMLNSEYLNANEKQVKFIKLIIYKKYY